MTITNEQLRLEALRLAIAFCTPAVDTDASDLMNIAEDFFAYVRHG